MMQGQWDDVKSVKQQHEPADYDKIWNNIINHIETSSHQKKSRVIKFTPEKTNQTRLFLKIAASILIPIISITLIFLLNQSPEPQIAILEKIVPAGEKVEIELPDGTKVWLNGASSIKYPENFTEKTRQVELKGEGFFSVKSNKENPFIVDVNQIKVKVTGTKFNISAYKNDNIIKTTLVEGIVNVISKNKQTELKPNSQCVYNKRNMIMKTSKVDTEIETAWLEGKLIFDNTSFGEMAKKLERWYGVEINLQEELKEKHRFTLTIRNENTKDIMKMIELTAPVEIVNKGNKYTISEKTTTKN